MEIVVENPEVPVGNLLENPSETLNFKLNKSEAEAVEEAESPKKEDEVILTPNGNGISNSESPFGRSISTNQQIHHGSSEDLLEGFKTKRYRLRVQSFRYFIDGTSTSRHKQSFFNEQVN